MKPGRKLRAIDLYSGVGGWSLGLRLAGIDVVGSYERWAPANETNFKNNRHNAQTVDIRRLALSDLPRKIDIVVGSPPCTQFSFSNRGGRGDIEDGLEDIEKFLEIVAYLKPKFWAMENVPRVARIIEDELAPGGRLSRFRRLNVRTHIYDMATFGLPQRRRRCVAGNFDFELLSSYTQSAKGMTLGDVVSALSAKTVVDPTYAVKLPAAQLRDHVTEEPLDAEEVRINRSNKTLHPVYNSMPFPDPTSRSVRTITATCTRVSRESVIIRDPDRPKSYRRLTLRERASLQGFPITFQFYGKTYGHKQKMIGNALPPPFAFHVAHAMKGTPPGALPCLSSFAAGLASPSPPPAESKTERRTSTFPADRTFCFAIPSLRLKSGVRFQLRNRTDRRGGASWEVEFYFGHSKAIHELTMDRDLQARLTRRLTNGVGTRVRATLASLASYVADADIANMQRLWAHRGVGGTRPFMLLDQLDEAGTELLAALEGKEEVCARLVADVVEGQYGSKTASLPGLGKLEKHASLIVAGLLVGACVNSGLAVHASKMAPRVARRARMQS